MCMHGHIIIYIKFLIQHQVLLLIKIKHISINHLNRSIERALDEATYTGELNLNGRTLREFPINNKCDLSDTITAGL